MSTNIRLQSSDGAIFDTDVTIASTSGTIKTLLESCDNAVGSETVIPLPNVTEAILRKILEYANYHKDDPVVDHDDDNHKQRLTILPWDAEFLKMEQETLMDLIAAANYLDMKSLLNVACKTVANMMKNKTASEIREVFKLTNDLTPAEEERIRKENLWCTDF